MDELTQEFKQESLSLVEDVLNLLEEAEGNFTQKPALETCGQLVDRIMGGAKTLSMTDPENIFFRQVGDFAELCKSVSYKGSQIAENEQLYNVVVALLLDAVEVMQELLGPESTSADASVKKLISETFLDRLKWVSQQFDKSLRGTLKSEAKSSQDEIDQLLKKLGL